MTGCLDSLRRFGVLGLAAALVTSAACTLIDAPTQCSNDDDCARFNAKCDVTDRVCVAPDSNSSGQAYAAPLDAGASSAPTASSTPPSPEASGPATTAATQVSIADAGSDARVRDAGKQMLASTIQCGDTTCPAGGDSVCCIGANGPACAKAADCADTPVACDDTEDCAGTPNTICCAFNDGMGDQPILLRSSCVAPDQCDANGPQDQMCNANDPASQCDSATPGHTACTPFTYANATYSFCAAP
jgi:hypothetical protein